MRIISKLFLSVFAYCIAAASAARACDTTLDVVLSSSGGPESGFDNYGKDFDILRQLVIIAGLDGALGKPSSNPDDGVLRDVTVFAPWDDAFFRLAKALSDFLDDEDNAFKPKGYDETGAFQYIAGALTFIGGDIEGRNELITNILLYHVADEEVVFRKLAKGKRSKNLKTTITTLFDGMKIPVTMAMPTDYNSMRLKLKHNADGSDFRFPKIQNKLYDIKTCNGRLNVIKDVLIPLEV